MPNTLPKKIGKVPITYLSSTGSKQYEDPAEAELLKLFSNKNQGEIDQARRSILASQPTWALSYHLSPSRQNLLGWYEFKKGARILEIGAGCGAITEGLIKNEVLVTALELSAQRSKINALRNQQAGNLNIVVGNLEDFNPEGKFDYVVCVGVLEYAGTYIDSDQPYRDFTASLARMLNPGGKLLLAIENKFGLKYLAGAKEDHTGRHFEGLNGYPNAPGVRTFGRRELRQLLVSSGFGTSHFYFPYPDYKMPFFVYSEKFYPGKNTVFPLGRLPAPAPDRSREHFFSEQAAMISIEGEGLFPELSNSFLVEVSL